jgi:peptide deformylase
MRVTTIADSGDSLLLRSACTPLTQKHIEEPEFGRLVASMIETVGDPENEGVGIAAPQVGVLRRVVVVQRFDKAGTPFEVYVNPEIVERSEEVTLGPEGCLSVPDRREEVLRASAITIRYRDAVTSEPREEHIEGFSAIIFQHEIDHLDGILYIDRLR